LLFDSAGSIVAEYDYDAFGMMIHTIGATSNNYLFHGEYYDSDIGLYYLRARWYSPEIGRFMSMDEWEGTYIKPITLNKYISFNNDPVNIIDPEGREGILGPTGKRITELLQGNILKNLLLEDENTETGIVERLFLAEIHSPWYDWLYSPNEAGRSFRLLGALLNNRKNDPRWPNTIKGVITDNKPREQFKWFSTYPKLLKSIEDKISDIILRASDETMPKHKEMKQHLNLVKLHAMITVSGFINDPYNGNTLYMRKEGSGKPKESVIELETIMGNTFYGE